MNTAIEKVNGYQYALDICQLFEDILDKHGIQIPDEGRCGDNEEACLYGQTYFELEEEVLSMLIEFAEELKTKELYVADRNAVEVVQVQMEEQKLRPFAFHMKHKKTGEERIKRVMADDVTHAHCKGVECGKDWTWTGTEPWHNIENDVQHIGNGYYKRKKG